MVGEDVGSLALESKSLQSRLAEQQQQHTREMSEVTAELHCTHKELVSPPWHCVCVHVTGGNMALTSGNEGSSLMPHCPNRHLCSPMSPLPARDPATPRNAACPVSQQAWSTLETAVALATFSPRAQGTLHHWAVPGAAGARPGCDFVLLTHLSGPRTGEN